LRATWVKAGDVDGVAAFAVQLNFSLDDSAGWRWNEAHDRHRHHALAAAAFAYQSERGLARQRQIDAIHRAHGTLFEKEVGLEIFNFKDGFRCVGHAQGILIAYIFVVFSECVTAICPQDRGSENDELIMAGGCSSRMMASPG